MSKKPSRFVATVVASAIAAAFSTGAYDAFASTNNDQEFSAALTNGWELLRYDELDSGAIKESVISLSAENQGSALSGSINAVLTQDILGQVQAVENFAEFGTSSETVRSDFSGLFFDSSDASGSTFENASIALSTESFAGGNTSVSGVQHNLGALTFTGSSTTISAESALTTSDSLESGDVSIVAGYSSITITATRRSIPGTRRFPSTSRLIRPASPLSTTAAATAHSDFMRKQPVRRIRASLSTERPKFQRSPRTAMPSASRFPRRGPER